MKKLFFTILLSGCMVFAASCNSGESAVDSETEINKTAQEEGAEDSDEKDAAEGETAEGDKAEGETGEDAAEGEENAEGEGDEAAEEEGFPDVTDEDLKPFMDVYNIPDSELPQLNPTAEGHPTATLKTSMGDITLVLYPEYAPKAVENFLTHAKDGYYDGVIFHRVMEEFMLQTGDPKGDGTGGESIWGEPFEDEFSDHLYNVRGAVSMANSGSNTNGSQFFIVQNTQVSEYTVEGLNAIALEEYEDDEEETFIRYVRANYPQYYQMYGMFGRSPGLPKSIIQKYLNDGGAIHLDYGHTVFGQVLEGMDVVDKIAKVEVEAVGGSEEASKPVEDVVIESIEVKEDN